MNFCLFENATADGYSGQKNVLSGSYEIFTYGDLGGGQIDFQVQIGNSGWMPTGSPIRKEGNIRLGFPSGSIRGVISGATTPDITVKAFSTMAQAPGQSEVSRIKLPSDGETGEVTVGTSAVQLSSTVISPLGLTTLVPPATNSGIVYYGFSNAVTTSDGMILVTGNINPIEIDDLSKVWMIATAANQKVRFSTGKE